MLTKRLMIHLMLEREYPSTAIAAVVGVSGETVRVHKHVKGKGNKIYNEIIARIAARRKTNEFWQNVEKVLTPLGHALRAKSDMKARNKLISRDID